MTLASNATATHRTQPLVTHNSPARLFTPCQTHCILMPSAMCSAGNPQGKPQAAKVASPWATHSNFPQEKIQVRQLQKQPTVVSHLAHRASPRSQPSAPAHVSSGSHPSFACVASASQRQLYHQSCAPHSTGHPSALAMCRTLQDETALVRHTATKCLDEGCSQGSGRTGSHHETPHVSVQELHDNSATSLPYSSDPHCYLCNRFHPLSHSPYRAKTIPFHFLHKKMHRVKEEELLP